MQQQGNWWDSILSGFGNQFDNSNGDFFSNLLTSIAPFAGLALGGAQGGLTGLTLALDQGAASFRNDQQAQYVEDLFTRMDRGRDDFLNLQQGLPGVSLDGQTFAPQGHTGQTLNFDDAFRGAERGLDFFRGNLPGTGLAPMNFGDLMARSGQGLEAGRNQLAGAGARSSQLSSGAQNQAASYASGEAFGDVPKIDTNFDEVQQARLAGTAAASREGDRQLVESMSSRAPMAGGLQGIQREQSNALQESAIGRSLEGQQIVGQTRQEQLAAEQFNSSLVANRQNQAFGASQAALMAELAGAINLGSTGAQMEQAGADRDIQVGTTERVANQQIMEQNLARALEMFSTELGLEQAAGNQDTERLMAVLQAAFQQSGLGGQFTQSGSGNELGAFGLIQPSLITQDPLYTSLINGVIHPDWK